MKGGGRIALGVGIGYLLGRTRKMRFALSLAGAAMAKRSTGTPGDLLERGTSLLKSSPELTRITDTVRGELLGAARSAAVTAASSRLDALNARLQQGSTPTDEDRRGSRETDSDEYEDEDASADDDLEDEYEEDEDQSDQGEDEDDTEAEDDTERPAARRARRPSTAGRRAASSRTADRSADSADRKPSGSRGRRSRTDTGAAPVRRTRR
ncbi:hypothetical protein IU450_14100 [Nocardia abscessus]|uniref:hypothetical protein n=1 Tax=Nocardia abscessus TaxID=120957 RepID=UPI001895C975|nr:hypothetical protein [Nocardia abscessus]MBF6337012.1 hypothetical protein [Nocardia abscessus]